MTRLLCSGLKREGSSYAREMRKVWEASVRDAESLDELRRALQGLEEAVRAVQVGPRLDGTASGVGAVSQSVQSVI